MGNHEELMQMNGLYKEMYEGQKKWYFPHNEMEGQ